MSLEVFPLEFFGMFVKFACKAIWFTTFVSWGFFDYPDSVLEDCIFVGICPSHPLGMVLGKPVVWGQAPCLLQLPSHAHSSPRLEPLREKCYKCPNLTSPPSAPTPGELSSAGCGHQDLGR